MKIRVLVLCTANSARSQMAEGLLRHDYREHIAVESAGTRATAVRPEAIAVMQEVGVDISDHLSKSVDTFADTRFDYVLTVCDGARETCPVYPGHVTRIHRDFPDPALVAGTNVEHLNAFRSVRDEIRVYLKEFAALIGKGGLTSTRSD